MTESGPSPAGRPRDDLETQVDDLQDRVAELEHRVDWFEAVVGNLLTVNVERTPDDDDLAYVAAQFALAEQGAVDDVRDELRTARNRLHRERSKLARRVSALEDELGVSAATALGIAEGGEVGRQLSKLGRLVRYGPEAVNDHPTATMFRAQELVENWNRWGTVRNDALGRERRLASNKHDLKTRLEDARDESLAWRQVYRAMELVADWSDGDVTLEEGSADEGRYVLVHRLDDEGGR